MAISLDKHIVPVYVDIIDVPPMLRIQEGVNMANKKPEKVVEELYQAISKNFDLSLVPKKDPATVIQEPRSSAQTTLAHPPRYDLAPQVDYYQLVVSSEAKVLTELEQLIGKPIPHLPKINLYSFGFTAKDKHVIGLGLFRQRLISLPEPLGKLKRLSTLYAFGNHLNSLPSSFGQLKRLTELKIQANALGSLPKSFGNLTSLKVLDLSDNPLSSLPASLGNLKDLKILNLHGISLKFIPASIRILQTQGCYISGIDISSLNVDE